MKYLTIITIILNGLLFGSLLLADKNKIYIEYHFDSTILILYGLIFVSLFGLIILIFTEILKKPLLKSLLNIFISFGLWLFSFNLWNLFKALVKILTNQDIIYKGNFFTIHYLFTQEELLAYVDEVYQKISPVTKPLTQEEKLQILNNATTMKQTRLNVEAYCNYESTALWFQIKNLLTNFGSDHPVLLIGMGVGVIAILVYFGYNIFNIKGDIKKLKEERAERIDLRQEQDNQGMVDIQNLTEEKISLRDLEKGMDDLKDLRVRVRDIDVSLSNLTNTVYENQQHTENLIEKTTKEILTQVDENLSEIYSLLKLYFDMKENSLENENSYSKEDLRALYKKILYKINSMLEDTIE